MENLAGPAKNRAHGFPLNSAEMKQSRGEPGREMGMGLNRATCRAEVESNCNQQEKSEEFAVVEQIPGQRPNNKG